MGRKKIYNSREEYRKLYYIKNKEKIQEDVKKWHSENPEKRKEYWENFKENGDIEKHKSLIKKWNSENKERINKLQKNRKKNNINLKL